MRDRERPVFIYNEYVYTIAKDYTTHEHPIHKTKNNIPYHQTALASRRTSMVNANDLLMYNTFTKRYHKTLCGLVNRTNYDSSLISMSMNLCMDSQT